jgi:copper chaperone CopZ
MVHLFDECDANALVKELSMASVTINLPKMFADHHVLKVRDVLYAVDGVEDVVASSAWQAVIVTYQPDKTNPTTIEKTLTDAGYPPDAPTPILATLEGTQNKDPAWAAVAPRARQTNAADAKMSKII